MAMAWYPTPNNIGSTLAAPHTPGGSLVLQTGDGARFVASPSHVPSVQAPILVTVILEDKTTSPSVLTPLAVLEVTSMSGDTIPAGSYTVRWPTSGGDGTWTPDATTVYRLDIALDNEHLEQFRVAIDALDSRVTTTEGTLAGLSEAIDDRVAALLVQGSGVILTYDDVANTLTIAASGGGGGGAPTDATYLVRTGSTSLSAETALDTLGGPGLLKFAADGTPSKAVAGTDYLVPTGSGAALTGITTNQIGGLNESIDDRVATLLVQGPGITMSYDDVGDALVISVSDGGGAPTDATYLVRTGSASLSAETALDTLSGPGLLKFAADGTPSKAVAGTDYVTPSSSPTFAGLTVTGPVRAADYDLPSTGEVRFSATTDPAGSPDLRLRRDATGGLEVIDASDQPANLTIDQLVVDNFNGLMYFAGGVSSPAIEGTHYLDGTSEKLPVPMGFAIIGTPTVGTGKRTRPALPYACVVHHAALVLETPPSGGPFTVTVRRSADGGATFPTVVVSLSVADGTRSTDTTTITTAALAAGDFLRLDVDAVNGGADATLVLTTLSRNQ